MIKTEEYKGIKIEFEENRCVYANYKEIEPKKYSVDIILSIEGFNYMQYVQSVTLPLAIDESLISVENEEELKRDLVKWIKDLVADGFFSWKDIVNSVDFSCKE